MSNKSQLKGIIMLLLTALIWGTSFVAQSVGLKSVGAFTFTGVRILLGAATLLPFIMVGDRASKMSLSENELAIKHQKDKKTMHYGMILGIFFCIANIFQQYALYYSTPGKVAFVTALYMFFVPLFGLFIGKKSSIFTWICVAFGFVGLYFLCIDPNSATTFSTGDILTFICSVAFAIHILLIERFTPKVDAVRLSFWQFLTSGTIASILMFIFEKPTIASIFTAIVPILYSGVMSIGVAYTFQIIGQKYTDATVASLILCLESVFGVLSSVVLLHERLSGRELLGCSIMFAAIILSQCSDKIAAKFNLVHHEPVPAVSRVGKHSHIIK